MPNNLYTVFSDNPLSYVMSIVKLDATGECAGQLNLQIIISKGNIA